jgi:hypothetical protein
MQRDNIILIFFDPSEGENFFLPFLGKLGSQIVVCCQDFTISLAGLDIS